jgi:hypothetical protein
LGAIAVEHTPNVALIDDRVRSLEQRATHWLRWNCSLSSHLALCCGFVLATDQLTVRDFLSTTPLPPNRLTLMS